MATASARQRSFAFVFPMASGHINSSFPVARGLVAQGHAAHYVCPSQMRHAVEDAGAIFHDNCEVCPELYEGRKPDLHGALASLKAEHALEGEKCLFVARAKLRYVQIELQLPGLLRLLREVKADAVIYCPVINREGAVAAMILNIPSIPVFTHSGLGGISFMIEEFLAKAGVTVEDAAEAVRSFTPNVEAMNRINEHYGLDLQPGSDWFAPVGLIDAAARSAFALVTTTRDLADPIPEVLQQAYGKLRVEYVGAMLDREGALRATMHKFAHQQAAPAGAAGPPTADEDGLTHAELLAEVRAARSAGREVVLVSMGTITTGDDPMLGWNGRFLGPDGRRRGLTGSELCRGAWGGTFDAFGSKTAGEGPLIVVSVGLQPNPLGELVVPPNAVCVSSVPQVDILKGGVKVFLQHGGQNSFMEALANSVPIVVCPGFGDQFVNSRKAVALGVGLMVDRPDPDPGTEVEPVVLNYRNEVCHALLEVASRPRHAQAAAHYAAQLQLAGGVPRAIELILEAVGEPHKELTVKRDEQRLRGPLTALEMIV